MSLVTSCPSSNPGRYTGLHLDNLPRGGGGKIKFLGGNAFSNFNAQVIMSFVLLEFQGGEILSRGERFCQGGRDFVKGGEISSRG